MFALVLCRLPVRSEQRWTWVGQAFRVSVSVSVGLVMFVFALAAGSGRFPTTTSAEMIDRALPDGHGRNVVNVILVDFRGFDTVGELAAASIGAVALARAVKRPGRPPEAPPDPPDPAVLDPAPPSDVGTAS